MSADESIMEPAGILVPTESSGRRLPPRLTLGLMMILIAVVAADFSAMAALTRGERPSAILFAMTGTLVLLYDLLLYLTLLVLKRVFRSGEDGRPSTGQIAATAAVLAVFVGIPVGALIGTLMSL